MEWHILHNDMYVEKIKNAYKILENSHLEDHTDGQIDPTEVSYVDVKQCAHETAICHDPLTQFYRRQKHLPDP
jgi:hypothetical protein